MRYDFGAFHSRLTGHVGMKIDKCIKNGIFQTDYHKFISAFEDKADSTGLFCGEFWGKWFTSAVLAYEYDRKEEYLQILQDAVRRLMRLQEEDGRLSCSAVDFSDWDIWGRKYVLLGLIAYYDISKDTEVLLCAERLVDNLISTLERTGRKTTDVGLDLLQGAASCSILQPIVRVYKRTGNKTYLDFAQKMVSWWSEPNKYNHDGFRLLEKALSDVAPADIEVPKAYEVMSCLEGVLELYECTGKEEYLQAVCKYMDKVLDREIMLTGSGSGGELWCDGAYEQTQILETPMETCVTATFMKICASLLCVTGEGKWAEQLEITLYNALLGAMKEDGSWWAYFSPLQGQRVLSPVQIERIGSSCCVVNGPRALMEVPKWAVMRYAQGIAIHLYEDGSYRTKLYEQPLHLSIHGGYPRDNKIVISFEQVPEKEFTVKLRIPSYAEETVVKINGETIACINGQYCEIRRVWSKMDRIELVIDQNLRIVSAPGNRCYKAVMAGPVVLALDSSRIRRSWKALRLMNTGMEWKTDAQTGFRYVKMQSIRQEGKKPIAEKVTIEGAYIAYQVSFLYRPVHFFDHEEVKLLMCDYASCGKHFEEQECIRVWLPQPLLMSQAFPIDTGCIVAGIKGDNQQNQHIL